MFIKQLSVFLENRKGRLDEALTILKNNDINIISASLADSTEFGLLRLLTSDTEKAKTVLKESGFMAKTNDIIAIVIPHRVGSLVEVLSLIDQADINIEYMYGLSTESKGAAIAIKTSDLEATIGALEPVQPRYYTEKELAQITE